MLDACQELRARYSIANTKPGVKRGVWMGQPVRRVLFSLPLPERERRPSIYEYRCRHPPAAYPDTRAGSPRTCPVWPCSGWGLPSLPGHPGSWWSLTPPFHPYLRFSAKAGNAGGLFSVALACGLPRVGVTHHPALRSPDVPRATCVARGRLAVPSGSSLPAPPTAFVAGRIGRC